MTSNTNDLKLLQEIFYKRKEETERFARMYLYTTENIAGYVSGLPQSETALTVTSSGDHILNLLNLGVKFIDAFDINPLARYIAELKVAALNLTYEEFTAFFFGDCRFGRQLYSKIRPHLSDQAGIFWDYAYELSRYSPTVLLGSNIFNTITNNENIIKASNLYSNKAIYNQITLQAKTTRISYTTCSITELPQKFQSKKYDTMLFSNISDYLINIYGREGYLENYKELLDEISSSMLKEGGYIFFAYIYDINSLNHRTDIDDLDKVQQTIDNYSIRKIKSILSPVKKDVVLIRRGGCKDGE